MGTGHHDISVISCKVSIPHNSQHKIPGFFQEFFQIFKSDFRKSLAVFLTLERGLIHLYKAASFAFNAAIHQNQAELVKKSSLVNEYFNLRYNALKSDPMKISL